MIAAVDLTKAFGEMTAVNKVSLEVQAGEIFGLVGPDGAGKSTIIRLFTGILTPTAGEVSVLGAANPETVKGDIGYVPQKFSLYGDLTVMQNIKLMGTLYGKSSAEIAVLAKEILTFTNLLPFADRLADNLSGGMKQKLALAAGLMHRPKIFFLDEPTTGVDPVSRREFWQMLYRLNKDGMTVFISTPYMDEAELCTRVAFMNEGVIKICDSPQGLRSSYPYKILELSTPVKNVRQYLSGECIMDVNAFGNSYHLVVRDAGAAKAYIADTLAAAGIPVISLHEIIPTLEDVFVALTREVS